jgi:four helix bundle protein
MKLTRFDNPKANDYRDLIVWQKGIGLAKLVYKLTQSFPNEEKFGLVSQMRRSVVSISSNIAEGQARHTTAQFIQFISNAEGSVAELDTQLYLATELGFATAKLTTPCFDLVNDLRRMLNGLRRRLEAR